MKFSCLCGTCVIQIEGEPISQFYCHCDDCRTASGGAYTAVAIYPEEAMTVVAGQLATWAVRNMPRHHCAVCGTRMLATIESFKAVGLMGNLLPKSRFAPSFHIQCADALLPVLDGLPHYERLPVEFGGSGKILDW